MSDVERMPERCTDANVDIDADGTVRSRPTYPISRRKRMRTRDDKVMKWRQGGIGEETQPRISTGAWSASELWSESNANGDGIQMKDMGQCKRRKSSGVSPKSFHRSIQQMTASPASPKAKPSSDSTCTTSQINHHHPSTYDHVRKLLRNVGRSVKYRNFAEKYQAFEKRNPFLEFPFQEPALNFLDGLIEKHRNENDKNNHLHDDDDREDSDDDDDPMWSSEPRIFSVEKSSTGKRRYIVTTLGRFLHHYWRHLEPSARHYYELIREKEPCRLYFDIEYNKKANPNITQHTNETLMDEFITQLQNEIHTVYGISIHRSDIVDLDSSTAKKFSRHLIVHFPEGELFEDAVSCGVFVKSFVGRLAEEEATGVLKDKSPVLAKYLFVYSKPPSDTTASPPETPHTDEVKGSNDLQSNIGIEGDSGNESNGPIQRESAQNGQHTHGIHNKSCFIDTGVYTRNRLFRILGSSKYGKAPSAALRIASANQFPFTKGFTNAKFYAPTKQKMRKNDECDGVSPVDDDDEEFNWKSHGLGLVQTLVTPTAVHCKHGPQPGAKILQISDQDQTLHNSGQRNTTTISRKGWTDTSRSIGPGGKRSSYKYNYGPSPFPTLDNFVNKNLANRKGVNGAIRAWSTIKGNLDTSANDDLSQDTIIYQIKDNRWCENIQRCHKSNNVMWHVSIRDMKYWQTCWDPECRMMSFRGVVNDLPHNTQSEINDICLDKAMQIDEEFENALATLELPESTVDGTRKHNSAAASMDETVSLKADPNYKDDGTDPEFDEALMHAINTQPELFP